MQPRNRNRPPDHLPSEILNHPAVIAACRTRDIGKLFRIINNLTDGPAQFTASHIARRCELTQSTVGEYMNGTRNVRSVEVMARIADGLAIPGARLGLARRPWEPTPDTATEPPVPSERIDQPSTARRLPEANHALITRRRERHWTQQQAADAIAAAVSVQTGQGRPTGIDAQWVGRLDEKFLMVVGGQ